MAKGDGGKGKGGNKQRRGKNNNDQATKRELVFKEDGQEYAVITKMLGNNHLEADCIDGVKRFCTIRGKMRKKVWMRPGDLILVSLRDYQDGKADIIGKYSLDEAKSLKIYGEIPSTTDINEDVNKNGGAGGGDDGDIEFDFNAI